MEKLRYECQGHKISIFKNVEKQRFSATTMSLWRKPLFILHIISNHFVIYELSPSKDENNSSNQPLIHVGFMQM